MSKTKDRSPSFRKARLPLVSVNCLMIFLVMTMAVEICLGQDKSPLKPRLTLPKPDHTVIEANRRVDKILIKFREGTKIRARIGQLVALTEEWHAAEEGLLRRADLDKETVLEQVGMVNRLLSLEGRFAWRRLFSRPESILDTERSEGERTIGEELADLNLFFALELNAVEAKEAERLIDLLNSLDIVELAYLEPISQLAACDNIPPTTPYFTHLQGYLTPAPTGINAQYAWTYQGGRGEGVKIIDIELGWKLTHEDLPDVLYQEGEFDELNQQHGTAVFGEIAACDNCHGVTGIAHKASVGVYSALPDGTANAINKAAASDAPEDRRLDPSDIILIELGRGDGTYTCNLSCTCTETGTAKLPIEDALAEFEAIKAVTARNIIVVEPAGNGTNNLNCSAYEGRYDRSTRDSQAIMVGASNSNDRRPAPFTNYGNRVDLHGWGENVMTTGCLPPAGPPCYLLGGTDQNRWYTPIFNGTSSASPMVAGAAADIQGILRARGLPILEPYDMKETLLQTGTPQGQDTRHIKSLASLAPARWYIYAAGLSVPHVL